MVKWLDRALLSRRLPSLPVTTLTGFPSALIAVGLGYRQSMLHWTKDVVYRQMDRHRAGTVSVLYVREKRKGCVREPGKARSPARQHPELSWAN